MCLVTGGAAGPGAWEPERLGGVWIVKAGFSEEVIEGRQGRHHGGEEKLPTLGGKKKYKSTESSRGMGRASKEFRPNPTRPH